MELNKIYPENCLDTMSRMPDGFVDLVVTSPPYDNLREYKGYSFDFEPISKELFRVINPGGVLVWVVGDSTVNGSESLTSFKQAIYFKEVIGFRVHDTMIYQKNNIPLTHNRYENCFEYMFIFSKGKPNVFNPLFEKAIAAGTNRNMLKSSASTLEKRSAKRTGMNRSFTIGTKKIRDNIFFYPVGKFCTTLDENAFDHPAIFPDQLAADHIYSWSNAGEIVYDPFGGSGTVAKMAHLANRNWILSEISKEYCELAEKRIAPYLNQAKLQFA